MKLALLICLLAFISCKKDIMTIIKCLYESPKIKELITDVITAIVTKDFTKLWENIKKSLPELIQTVIKCITETNEPNLLGRYPCHLCNFLCVNKLAYADCVHECQRTCYDD